MERRYRKGLWQKVVSRNLDPCPGQKRGRQIGHPAPDILTGVARRHGPGSVFRFAGWAPTGPGPARAVLGWPAGACWRPQQPKHRLHTPPELWNAFGGPGGGLGCLCHSEVAPCSNSLTTQLQSPGGVTAAALSRAFCEHSPEIHTMAELWAARRAPTAANDLGFTVSLAMAHERHCIRLRLAAGAWRDFSKSIRARLPFVHTSAMDAVVQVDLSRCDERTEREYRNHADSFARGNHGAGGRDRNQRGLSAPATQHHDPPS